jgi:hypothetical protein
VNSLWTESLSDNVNTAKLQLVQAVAVHEGQHV